MDLESFLSLHGTSWDEVGAVARQELGGVAPDEALFAVGSPVEGRASPKSDLDLLWITPRTEADLPARERVTWVVGRCLVDARVLRAAYVEQLVGRLEPGRSAIPVPALPGHPGHHRKIDKCTGIHSNLLDCRQCKTRPYGCRQAIASSLPCRVPRIDARHATIPGRLAKLHRRHGPVRGPANKPGHHRLPGAGRTYR